MLSKHFKVCLSALRYVVLLSLMVMAGVAQGSEMVLWFQQPAEQWEETLPVGNGRLGAMVFGGIEQEHIQLNEDTVWSGSPVNIDKVGAYKYLGEVRRLLFEGKYLESQEIVEAQFMSQKITHSYQTLGDIGLRFKIGADISDYRRELNLDSALARVIYRDGDATFMREVFSSAPHQVLVVRLTCDKTKRISFELDMSRPEFANVVPVSSNRLVMKGQVDHGKKNEGVRFEAHLQVIAEGGDVKPKGTGLLIKDANAVTLLLAAATNYYGGDPAVICTKQLAAAAKISYQTLREAHMADYQRFFRRVDLNLGHSEAVNRPTDQRFIAVKQGKDDPQLIAQFFQLGRYLLISSSRPGCMPTNQQGIWNYQIEPPYFCGYTLNGTGQMQYWPAEVCNLSECHEPWFDLIDNLRRSGRKTARQVYGCRGFVASHRTNVWWFTSPMLGHDIWPTSAAWLCRHLWEHYLFTGDRKFLEYRAFPVMKEAAEFHLDWLVENPKTGKLVSGPSYSPENTFLLPDGNKGHIVMGPTVDQEIIWELFTNCLEAAKVLGIEDDFAKEVRSARDRLAGPQIGSDGRLMEWPEDFKESDPGHRRCAHLYALYPGYQITPEGTPQLSAAARKTLEYRLAHSRTTKEVTSQLGNTGRGLSWAVNWWARLGEGDNAYTSLNELLRTSAFKNLLINHPHNPPVFQIGGNLAGSAGIAEMLLQSHSTDQSAAPGPLHLLPALPKAWPVGYVKGLRARGGFEVDIYWEKGKLIKAVIKSFNGNTCKIRYGQKQLDFETTAGKSYSIDDNLKLLN